MQKPWEGRGASEFCTASSELDVPFIRCCAAEASLQRRLVALLADWWCAKIVPAALDVAFSFLDSNWTHLWLVVMYRYWAREYHLDTMIHI